MTYPILEFDPAPTALIEPSEQIRVLDVPEHCVICFFKEVLDQIVESHQARLLVESRWEDGPHRLYEIEVRGRRLAFFHPGIGAPLAAGLLEEAIARGCRKFVACGGAGVLKPDMDVGRLLVVSSAVRDEGTSYHYLPPSREVVAHPAGVAALVRHLEGRGIPHQVGKSWTTDAPYRETRQKIADRRAEGCIMVEMECAGMMAVAQFRGALYAQLLYGGDDLSGESWDNRGWQSRREIREQIFWLCAEACFSL
jgi:uridine phosphorylase